MTHRAAHDNPKGALMPARAGKPQFEAYRPFWLTLCRGELVVNSFSFVMISQRSRAYQHTILDFLVCDEEYTHPVAKKVCS
jgi:hypothetical protein